MSALLRSTLIAFVLMAQSAFLWAADFNRIGSYDFPTSASGEAQEHFLLGVGYLHSFGNTQAQAEFRRAQELDPDFAMAYWGEVFTYQHPFFGALSDGPADTLMRLGKTSEERLAKAPTDREKGFIRAAEAYALTPGGMPERRTAWMHAMTDLHEQYPDDDEVKAFTVVAMLAGATAAGPMRERINMRAGALALELFKDNDNHPGAAHYVIHAFDDPIHAPIALEAALKYRDIAPAVSHARHMPSHIFIQHGMWQEVAEWNESAFLVARELWKPGDAVGEQNHSNDWGQYGDLQMGDVARSKLWIERAARTLQENPGDRRSESTLATVKARHIIETQDWTLQPLTDDLSNDELLALGLSAANLGEVELAQQVADRLKARSESSPGNTTLKVIYLEVAAMARFITSHGATDTAAMQRQGELLLQEAIEITEAGRLPNGAANPLKPAHELYGEALLHGGRYEQAAGLFETSLLRMPNRALSLLGAARAYRHSGQTELAADKYRTFLSFWKAYDHAAASEAKEFLAAL